MPREERSVQIETGEGRNLQHAPGQNLAVSHDDDEVGRERADLRDGFFVSNPRRLQNRNGFSRQFRLDWRRLDALVAADRFVRLGDNTDQFMLPVDAQQARATSARRSRPCR